MLPGDLRSFPGGRGVDRAKFSHQHFVLGFHGASAAPGLVHGCDFSPSSPSECPKVVISFSRRLRARCSRREKAAVLQPRVSAASREESPSQAIRARTSRSSERMEAKAVTNACRSAIRSDVEAEGSPSSTYSKGTAEPWRERRSV